MTSATFSGTSIDVYNGSFSPLDQLGTTVFAMVASKQDKNPLKATNWSLDLSADQLPYRSIYTDRTR